MALYKGTVKLSGMISPTDTEDTYPTHDDELGKGGYRSVANIEAMNLITEERRKEGMIVHCLEENLYFQLQGGILNDHWVSWTLVGGGSGEGDNSYIRPTPTPVKVGGVEIGTIFTGSIQDALDKILYPYVAPGFSSFVVSGIGTTYEIGSSLEFPSVTFNWGYSNNNVEANSIRIMDTDNSILIENLSISPTTWAGPIKPILFDTLKTVTWKIQAKNTKGITFERTYSATSRYNFYYGNSDLDVLTSGDQIQTLNNKALDNTIIGKTLNFGATGYKWICIPQNYPTPTKWVDNVSGFMVAMEEHPIEVDVTNQFGIITKYICYRTTNKLTQSIQIKIS